MSNDLYLDDQDNDPALEIYQPDSDGKLPDLPPPHWEEIPIRPGGVFGVTVKDPDSEWKSRAWSEYLAQQSKNAGYVGPDLFGGGTLEYRKGLSHFVVWDGPNCYIVQASHLNPSVEAHWVKGDKFTRGTLLELLRVVWDTAWLGDSERSEAQTICQELIDDLELPQKWWEGLIQRRKLGAKGRHILAQRLMNPKRTGPLWG